MKSISRKYFAFFSYYFFFTGRSWFDAIGLKKA